MAADPTAVETAVYHAVLELMGGLNGHTMTRGDIIDAVERGTKGAFVELIGGTGHPMTKDDLLKAVARGVEMSVDCELGYSGGRTRTRALLPRPSRREERS